MAMGLRGYQGVAAAPFTKGPYTWDQQVTFTQGLGGVNSKGTVVYVDGSSGSDGNGGTGWSDAKATIQAGVTLAGAFGTVFVLPKAMAAGATDPGNYTENIIIPATHECLSIVGIGNRTQGGLPQLKVGGTTTAAILTIRAPGCMIRGVGINGAGATGGGILLDDDGSTKTAFGTEIAFCHFKNCAGTDSTGAETGGAIQWNTTGGAWQVWIHDNYFYKNVGDIVLLGTSAAVPQDVLLENNVHTGPAANTDCYLYLAGGSGMTGLCIRNCHFGALPALSGGNQLRALVLTGCTGVMSGCTFAMQAGATGGTRLTWIAAGTAAKVPSTVLMVGNFGLSVTASESGEITTAA
jgi:hypothetical protein